MHISIPSGRYSYRTVVIYNTYKGERRLKIQVPCFSTKPATAVWEPEQLVGKETASLLFCRVCSGLACGRGLEQSRVSVTQRGRTGLSTPHF